MYLVSWLTLLCIAKLLKIGSYCITLSCICKSFVGIKSAIGAFSPQIPNHLNQSCFLQQIKSSGLHNTMLPMQSFTCYVLPLISLSLLRQQVPCFPFFMHPAPLQWYFYCCSHFIAYSNIDSFLQLLSLYIFMTDLWEWAGLQENWGC